MQKRRTAGVIGAILSDFYTGAILAAQFSDNNFYVQSVQSTGGTGGTYRAAADATSAFTLIEGHYASSTLSAYKNNSAYSLGSALTFSVSINGGYISQLGRYGASSYTDGHIIAVVHYNTSKTSVRSGIATKLNTRFNIY